MKILFIGLKNDEQAHLALNILIELGQKVLILETEDKTPKTRSENEEILVALFTTPNPKLLRHSHLSRVASHRTMASAPPWANDCHLLIAIREQFPQKKSHPKEMCREWIKIAKNLATTDLAKSAPWGSLPTAPTNFKLYQKWITNRLGLNPEELGVQFVLPVNNLSQTESQAIRSMLKLQKDKRLTDRVIRLAQRTDSLISTETIITTGTKLIELTKEKRLLVESGSEFEMILNCLWRALSGQRLTIIAPLCPAWTHDESGYTFCGLEENSRGVFYEKMAPELDYLIAFLKTLGVDYKVLAWVADIMWFDMADDPALLSKTSLTKERFMSIVGQQCQMIQSDLESRGINAEAQPLLEMVPERNYLAESSLQQSTYVQLLKTSPAVQKHFEGTLKIKNSSYQKQYGVPVIPDNPHPKVKEGLIRDMISHLAPLTMLKKVYSTQNFLFFLQSEPFTQLYKDVPYIAWHAYKK